MKLSGIQLRRFMSLVSIEKRNDLPLQDAVQNDLIKNSFVDVESTGLSLTDKGVNEINRLSRIAGLTGEGRGKTFEE